MATTSTVIKSANKGPREFEIMLAVTTIAGTRMGTPYLANLSFTDLQFQHLDMNVTSIVLFH